MLPKVELELVDLWLGDLSNLLLCGTTEMDRLEDGHS